MYFLYVILVDNCQLQWQGKLFTERQLIENNSYSIVRDVNAAIISLDATLRAFTPYCKHLKSALKSY